MTEIRAATTPRPTDHPLVQRTTEMLEAVYATLERVNRLAERLEDQGRRLHTAHRELRLILMREERAGRTAKGLRERRLLLGLTQQQLATRAKVGRSTVYALEHGAGRARATLRAVEATLDQLEHEAMGSTR